MSVLNYYQAGGYKLLITLLLSLHFCRKQMQQLNMHVFFTVFRCFYSVLIAQIKIICTGTGSNSGGLVRIFVLKLAYTGKPWQNDVQRSEWERHWNQREDTCTTASVQSSFLCSIDFHPQRLTSISFILSSARTKSIFPNLCQTPFSALCHCLIKRRCVLHESTHTLAGWRNSSAGTSFALRGERGWRRGDMLAREMYSTPPTLLSAPRETRHRNPPGFSLSLAFLLSPPLSLLLIWLW